MEDPFGRTIDYLRISVTDRCNLRCVYCMPASRMGWKSHTELLTDDEIVQVVVAAAGVGVRRVRLTGGEPTTRPRLVELVGKIARIAGIEEVTLTTNGMLLERLALPLKLAGLTRVNVSLDTLVPQRFKRITRFGAVDQVLRGIVAAEAAGLPPVKINTVVIRGVNDDELLPLASLTLEQPWHIRFIELMPIGITGDWGNGFPAGNERYISVHEMQARLAPLRLIPAEKPHGNGPARTFTIPGALGTVGFISPLGEHFCATCNRLRLTADGALRPCLLIDREIQIRAALREDTDLAPSRMLSR